MPGLFWARHFAFHRQDYCEIVLGFYDPNLGLTPLTDQPDTTRRLAWRAGTCLHPVKSFFKTDGSNRFVRRLLQLCFRERDRIRRKNVGYRSKRLDRWHILPVYRQLRAPSAFCGLSRQAAGRATPWYLV